MKPTSGNQSARGEQASRSNRKPQKGKKQLPVMSALKSVKAFQPAPSSQPWAGDEAVSIKTAAKPLFDDAPFTQLIQQKYPGFVRLMTLFDPESKFEDPEAPLAFSNPECDTRFSSAIFLCLSKGVQFFDTNAFHVYPNEQNPCGKYLIRIYENGNPVRLFFDDKIPCVSMDPPKSALLLHKDPKVILPTLLHKAFLRYTHLEPFTALDVVTTFTGFPHFEVTLDWNSLSFWFGRPDSIISLYIKEGRHQTKDSEGLGTDRLFHILDMVEIDQHRRFVKLQCPGAEWRGRFSGREDDTRHWTNQIRVILELDPETAVEADFFWMMWEDVEQSFDCVMVFMPSSVFPTNVRKSDVWNPKESQFYTSPSPFLIHTNGSGALQISAAPLLTTSPTNSVSLTLRKWKWDSLEAPIVLQTDWERWTTTTLSIDKSDEVYELEVISTGGYTMQLVSNDVKVDFEDYSDHANVTAAEGDLPFYVCQDDYATSVFTQRFELIGKVAFNLDQPGNFAFNVSATNKKHRLAATLFNLDTNDVICTKGLRSGSVALVPNKRGYVIMIFGLYNDTIFQYQPVDLVGKWRLKTFSDVPLSDVLNVPHINYVEVDGDCKELEESHEVVRYVVTGGCEAVVVMETSTALSLTFSSVTDDQEINVARGVGYAVLPSVKVPGEKEQTRLILRGVVSEDVTGFVWKIRIFSTGPVNCKEDTAPAEKTAAAIATWEKRRQVKPRGKAENTKRSAQNEQPVVLTPPEIHHEVLKVIEEEGSVLTKEEAEALVPNAQEGGLAQTSSETTIVDPGDELRERILKLSQQINEAWENNEHERNKINQIYTYQPKTE